LNQHPGSFIGWRIRQLRINGGLSEGDMSKRLGISKKQLENYESGSKRVNSGRLLDIAKTLNVPVTELFADIRPREAPRP